MGRLWKIRKGPSGAKLRGPLEDTQGAWTSGKSIKVIHKILRAKLGKGMSTDCLFSILSALSLLLSALKQISC
jgi:hypothetical protein